MRTLVTLALLLLAASSALAASPKPGDVAPSLESEDIKGRTIAVPDPGRVMLLSFASPSSGEAVGEIARALRVEHPELEILSFIDLSSFPGFVHRLVRSRIAKRHDDAVEATRAAFVRAGKTAPVDLDARVHIVPDFEAKSCKTYGASGDGDRPRLVLIGADGRIRALFPNPALAEVRAALAQEKASDPPR